MSLKMLSWTLDAPPDYNWVNGQKVLRFQAWKDLPSTEPWWSTNWVDVDIEHGMDNWSTSTKGFMNQFLNNSDKLYAIGCHEFSMDLDGHVCDISFSTAWKNANSPTTFDSTAYRTLTSDGTDINYQMKKSIRWLIQNYPEIEWGLQVYATNLIIDRILDDWNGTIANTFINELKQIFQIYQYRNFNLKTVEIDFEKDYTRYSKDAPDGIPDYTKFANLLTRIKNEVCIPLNLNLRVNLLNQTGAFTPSDYGWHDYGTLASAKDNNGNRAVDEYQLMTYDFYYGGSAPGPSTPLWWLEDVLKHVVATLPPDNTYIGNAGYGRRWPLHNNNQGTTLDYKGLMYLQNGMWVHNYQGTDGTYYFADQDFITFAGFEDSSSAYQMTFPHMYDKFKAVHGTIDQMEDGNGGYTDSLNTPTDSTGVPVVTSYSTTQHRQFTNVHSVLNNPTLSGNIPIDPNTGAYQIQSTPIVSEGLPQPYTFNMYTAWNQQWEYDPQSQTCILDPSKPDGSIDFSFNTTPGNYKVVALVGFPYFGEDHFDIQVNGTTYTIGAGIEEWYPNITNPSVFFWDCGEWTLNSSNTIHVGPTNGAWIGGFIICDDYNPYYRGGSIEFPATLAVMKKRGTDTEAGTLKDGTKYYTSEIVDAQFPQQMWVTAEALRRPPRPAIIWEDYFGDLINDKFPEGKDATIATYYAQAQVSVPDKGGGNIPYQDSNGNWFCKSGDYNKGFSQGAWPVHFGATDNDPAYIECDLTQPGSLTSAQFLLNKKFSSNINCQADIQLEVDNECEVGIRFLASVVGSVGDGYIVLLNWYDNTIKLVHEVSGVGEQIGNSIPMTPGLIASKMNRITLNVQVINNTLMFYVNTELYFPQTGTTPVTLPYPVDSGAYGIYVYNAKLKVYRLTIASLDRFEPCEKITVQVEGQNPITYGAVTRSNAPFDQYGLLQFTGYPGDQTSAVGAIDSRTAAEINEDPARAGTIFSTEDTPVNWSLDYKNLQVALVNSWIGKKNIQVTMTDPAIWLRTIYVGDSQGYSVSYNSDKIAFEKTVDLIMRQYKVTGIGMWTLGQEDPTVFDYIDKIR